jgi:hypothetical protein
VACASEYEIEEGLGAVPLPREQVVELEAELTCELAYGRVTLVDQLAAVLDHLPTRERRAV